MQSRANLTAESLKGLHPKGKTVRTLSKALRLQVVPVAEGETVAGLIKYYQSTGLVEFAEPDYERRLNLLPNDPRFTDGTLWALNNTGQSGGTTDADIDAP